MKLIKKLLKNMFYILFNFVVIVTQILPDVNWGNSMRGKIYKPFFKRCGSNFQVSKNVHFLSPNLIEIGNNVYLGYGNWIHGQGGLSIENEVMTGPFVCIATGNHTSINNSYRFGEHEKSPVLIKQGCWIGAHGVVLPGSTIEAGCLVAAGGVVTKNSKTSESAQYGGVPIKQIGNNIKK